VRTEDGARMSNMRISQRKRMIPHSTMKNMTCAT